MTQLKSGLEQTNFKNVDDDDSACPTNKTHFYEFKEHDLVIKLIEDLPKNVKLLRDKEKSFQQFLFVCDCYQEQPHLVDPFLSEIINKLIDMVKSCMKENNKEMDELLNECFSYMHALVKMRGYKKIIQYLPHEIVDLEPVLSTLERQDVKDSATWQTRYILLVWLSILSIVPFDLIRFDAIGNDVTQSIQNRLLRICIKYLFTTDKCQDASAFLLAKFMSRIDLQETVLPNFFNELFTHIREATKERNHTKLLGCLKCLASIYKSGKREELLKYTVPALNTIMEHDLLNKSDMSVVRKFHIKTVQRIGMVFFKNKIAKWRYQRGSRVLMKNVENPSDSKIETNGHKNGHEDLEEENDEKIPNEIEDIIEQLLLGLKDKDTIVRWSSAKGIGRITNRLPLDMAEDVLTSVLDLFTFVEDDAAWHGGCLAIAELGRRGLLLPKQLPMVVPVIIKALVFDKKLGNYSLGRNVRDAACYVCWSFARAFDANVIKPFVNQIAGALLIVTVFDREVNCRRAASASFQENVGRQGQFPHGIDILTKCDYYAVGQLQNCYLNLSLFIAGFDEYRQAIIDHLIEHKFNHWDQSIRELAAEALFILTPTCSDYMAYSVLPKLLKSAFSTDLNTRHGALISIAQLIHALSENMHNLDEAKKLSYLEVISDFKKAMSRIFEEKYFHGSSGEYMRPAVCFFIKKLSMSSELMAFKFKQNADDTNNSTDKEFLDNCNLFLNQCLEYNKESVQEAASEALPYFCDLKYYKSRKNNILDMDLVNESKLVDEMIENLLSTNREYVRSGYGSALGNLPRYLVEIKDNFSKIVKSIISASIHSSGPIKNGLVVKSSDSGEAGWILARRDCIKSLMRFVKQIKVKDDPLTSKLTDELILEMFDCFFVGVNDYSIDSKGDSGSRVREASMEAMENLIEFCAQLKIENIIKNKKLMTNIFGAIIQQSVERIDRTRSLAGRIYSNLLYNKFLKIDEFEFAEKLRSVFKRYECSIMDWNVAYNTLPLFVKLIRIKDFQMHLLTGLIYSIGSLTESLVKAATSSFLKELKSIESENKEDLVEIIDIIYMLCKSNLKSDRLSASLLKVVDLIIQNGLLNGKYLKEGSKVNYPLEFLNVFLENVKTTKDVHRLISYSDFFGDMIQFEEDRIRERCMIQLMIMLCHQYPRVRRSVASKFFEVIINYMEIFDNDEDYNECVNLLTETNWDLPVTEIRPIRNRICDITKTPKPVLKKVEVKE